jgi:hypothetical protein
VRAVAKAVPVVTGIGAIGWVLPDQWQHTEADLREMGLSKAQIEPIMAGRHWWDVQVSVRQYADLSDGRRVFDPVYVGVGIGLPPGLDDAGLAERLRAELEKAFREEMDLPDDWDTLMEALRRLGIEITLELLLELPLTVRLATGDDGPVPLPEM